MRQHSRRILRAGINRIRGLAGLEPLKDTEFLVRSQLKQAGQIIVVFALMLFVLIGLMGIAIDATYAWREALRVQRASDAAALAGVVYLPGNVGGGKAAAVAVATKNGYTATAVGVTPSTTVTPTQDATNLKQLDVTVSTQVPTFFSRIFGINNFDVSRSSKAVYIMPVPMGSPENYYGAFGTYHINGTTDVVLKGPADVGSPVLNARGFWGSTLTQGGGVESGDAYMPVHNAANGTGTNPNGQDTKNYHNYAVYMPPGTTNGHVWIFDPVFCDTDGKQGTGEQWVDTSGGAVYTKYELYNTNNQPYNLDAQTPLGDSGSLFASMNYYDNKEGGTQIGRATTCVASPTTNKDDPRYWHNGWWELTGSQGANQTLSGGVAGQTYRVHVTTDPGNTSQDNVNAINNYAIFASATGDSPQVYGDGSMQMYTPLPQSSNSTFYLAQIEQQAGAGKTVEISLWDPGDTGNLTADLSVWAPCVGTNCWQAVTNMNWTSEATGSGATCSSTGHGGPVSSIRTSQNGNSYFNSCWLRISIYIPTDYTAPQDGWWKIKYAMGSGSQPSTDETTWQVNIRGNPVHLI